LSTTRSDHNRIEYFRICSFILLPPYNNSMITMHEKLVISVPSVDYKQFITDTDTRIRVWRWPRVVLWYSCRMQNGEEEWPPTDNDQWSCLTSGAFRIMSQE
jgi:hypothetical protein